MQGRGLVTRVRFIHDFHVCFCLSFFQFLCKMSPLRRGLATIKFVPVSLAGSNWVQKDDQTKKIITKKSIKTFLDSLDE